MPAEKNAARQGWGPRHRSRPLAGYRHMAPLTMTEKQSIYIGDATKPGWDR